MRVAAFIILLCACSCVFVEAFIPCVQTCTSLRQTCVHAQAPESSESSRSKRVMAAAGFAKLRQRLQADAVAMDKQQNMQVSEQASSKGAAVARYAAISAALFAPFLFFGSPLLQRPALAVSHETVAQGEIATHAVMHCTESAAAAALAFGMLLLFIRQAATMIVCVCAWRHASKCIQPQA
jgi:hypothetical protein